MIKDPAVLFYNDKWSASVAGIKSEFRAWYLDLIIYQFSNSGIPEDLDTMAGICHVLPSEYEKFTQFVSQFVPQKFRKCEETGLLINGVASEIIKKRELFKEKRSRSGIIGNIIKTLRKDAETDDDFISKANSFLKNLSSEELKNIQLIANPTHLRTHLRTLLLNVNVIVIENNKSNSNLGDSEGGLEGEKEPKVSKPIPVPVKKREAIGLHAKFTEAWFETVERTWGFAPRFTAIDGKKINSIMAYLRSLAAKRGEVPTDETLVQVWNQILQAALNDEFCRKNFTLAVIDNQLNRLIMLCMPQPAKRSIHDIVAEEDRLMDEAAYGIPNQSQPAIS